MGFASRYTELCAFAAKLFLTVEQTVKKRIPSHTWNCSILFARALRVPIPIQDGFNRHNAAPDPAVLVWPRPAFSLVCLQ
jgi:hypothetical protein